MKVAKIKISFSTLIWRDSPFSRATIKCDFTVNQDFKNNPQCANTHDSFSLDYDGQSYQAINVLPNKNSDPVKIQELLNYYDPSLKDLNSIHIVIFLGSCFAQYSSP